MKFSIKNFFNKCEQIRSYLTHNFRPVVKMGPNSGKTVLIVKKSILMLIFISKRYLEEILKIIDILKRINCNNEQQVIKFWFLTDSVLKLIFLLDSRFFTFFDRWSCSMRPWESNFDSNKVFWMKKGLRELLCKKQVMEFKVPAADI